MTNTGCEICGQVDDEEAFLILDQGRVETVERKEIA